MSIKTETKRNVPEWQKEDTTLVSALIKKQVVCKTHTLKLGDVIKQESLYPDTQIDCF